jgi:Clp amino terminal domain, pathogenicity island component
MSRGPHSEAQLLRIATRRGDPDAGLTAIAELRRRLETWEAAHVDEAVNAGWSWQRIADSLGVTRQAAHARHARRSRHAKGRLVVAGRARRAVRRAREEAARMGAESLETDHLLLGLLLDPEEGPVKEALDACGIAFDAVKARAQPESALPSRRPQVSPHARQALEQSMREAVARGDARLDVEHLLLAVLHEPGGRGQRAVMAAGQSPGAVERRLSRALRAQSAASPASSGTS